ncbi:Ribose import ATP-binding protein RbsA [Paraburkholderia sediminicola]|uniref:Ribose import ATP-binding protein RbsA n=1 Tax=Paraburkholderia sediminicola TaxID=458836 RepID=A0A6J5CVR1_9BURK|nr:sugar ABC transporter ATP-binding protein [Paraburkholderia sediminicola]CAB3745596.1 Ribose import ATP-binding protein RbsA [Paraburkholderia sediminicola]
MNVSESLALSQHSINIDSVQKAFGPTIALAGASFKVPQGSVHALLGENGAGKSTLIKIISGMLQPDSGSISILGKEVILRDRQTAHELGIATAFQELTLVKDLTVAANLLMPYEPLNRFGLVRRRKSDEIVRAHLNALGIQDISPRDRVSRLTLPQRQKLEIARAILREPKVLLLDEPTSALSGPDIDWLGDIIEQQKRAGAAVLFISHRLSEVRQFCDEITILRNGKSAGTFGCKEISDEKVIELIIGRSLVAMFPPKTDRRKESARELLGADNLTAGMATDISFSLHSGEIVGVAALQGMGQLDLFRALSGDIAVEKGSIKIGGQRVKLLSPQDAIDSDIGISFIPEERKTEALFLRLDGRFNLTLPILKRYSKFGVPRKDVEDVLLASAFEKVQVTLRAVHSPMSAFSGGNQQKVVIAKWLVTESKIMLLFDPTRGVDVGTKYEIYVLLNQYLEAGGTVLLYSTELDEVLNLCDRVLVMYGGRVVTTVASEGGVISETDVMRAVLGSGGTHCSKTEETASLSTISCPRRP